jgi:hypothetical protein
LTCLALQERLSDLSSLRPYQACALLPVACALRHRLRNPMRAVDVFRIPSRIDICQETGDYVPLSCACLCADAHRPHVGGGGGSLFMSLGSPTPSASGEGWHRPEQYMGALRTDAAWLNKFRLGGFGELSEADKLHVVDDVGSLIQATHDAGVLYWPSKAMETVMEQILASTSEEENHSTHYDQDVDMRPPPPSMAWPGPSSSSHGCPPRGSRPLPRPPMGGEGACLRARGGTWALPPCQSRYLSPSQGVVCPVEWCEAPLQGVM